MQCASVTVDFKFKLDMQNSRELLGKNINRLSSRPGYSKAGLASYLGVSKSHISHYVKGVSFPGTEYLDKIAEYFNVSLAELFEEEPSMKSNEISVDEAFIVVGQHLGYKVKKVGKNFKE